MSKTQSNRNTLAVMICWRAILTVSLIALVQAYQKPPPIQIPPSGPYPSPPHSPQGPNFPSDPPKPWGKWNMRW
ncbi:unnamed protein product [Cylicocyclus nassatus]|uniref:Uncharacterized protein n=1 Tax=Cylicocyclus nassatus TaxID=53992 RepID=A0AA36GWM1_CYLNA|nr:unnamed protein product [Cylicocyclus nassatus]